MKKSFILIMGLFLLAMITGCSNTPSNMTQPQKIGTPYQKLNKTNQSKLHFIFQTQQLKQSTNNNLKYNISIEISNYTKKTVRFDKSKFGIYTAQKNTVKSKKHGSLVLKPNQTKTINKLMINISEKDLVGGSYFIYLNKDHKLADIIFAKALNSNNQTVTSNTSQ